MNTRRRLGIVAAFLVTAGCIPLFDLIPLLAPPSVKLVLRNNSATKYVSPNPGLCPQGLEVPTHSFLSSPPVIAPGGSASLTTLELDLMRGSCANADPSFMVGLCGWKFGDDPNNLSACSQRYGGQIGFQFNCGDTVIMSWTDSGDANGTWTTEVQPAAGNPVPAAPFQLMDTTGTCQL